MPSKKSFFNRTLFRKNLSRFWPLWGGVSAVGILFPLYMLLTLLQRGSARIDQDVFIVGLYQISVYFIPAFTCCYVILCAMAVWGYLYNARATGLMHTLPADRTCLFVTSALSGLAMVLIPYAVVGGMTCLIALSWGFFDFIAVVNTVLTVLLITMLFFGLATLCAMLTGHAVVLPVFYLLANFLARIMEMLTTSLAEEFLLSVRMMQDIGQIDFFSPVIQIYSSFHVRSTLQPDGSEYHTLQGLWVIALYALAGAAMLALAWFLYKKRHSESAGDVVAFRWLRPVFRYGLALLSGLTVGRLLFELFWVPLFQRAYYAEVPPLAVCLFLGGLLGYYGASMLLEKSLRVFRGSWKGALIVAAGTVAVCLLVSVDVFGLERRIPAPEEIESVTLMDWGVESGPFTVEDSPEAVARLRELHQAIIDDRDYIRSYSPSWGDGAVSRYARLIYQLKNGKTLVRRYDLWLTEDRVKTAGTYDNLLSEFYRDPVVRANDVVIPKGAELDSIDMFCNYTGRGYINSSDHASGDNRETRQIYAALQKDAAEGNIPAKDVLTSSGWSGDFYLQLEYRTFSERNGFYHSGVKTVYLTPAMTNTIDTLVELEYVTREELAVWQQDLTASEE